MTNSPKTSFAASSSILSQNRIADFEDWFRGFQEHVSARRAAGLQERMILRSEDGREVFVLLDSTDPGATDRFLRSRELAAFKEQIGVQEHPRYHRVMVPGSIREKILQAFEWVDRKDAQGFSSLFDAEGTFEFGHLPAVEGPAAIEAFCSSFFGSIRSLRHEVESLFEGVSNPHADSDPRQVALPCAMVRGSVHYVRLDGRPVRVSFSNYFELSPQGRFTRWQIYADTTPLFAAESV